MLSDLLGSRHVLGPKAMKRQTRWPDPGEGMEKVITEGGLRQEWKRRRFAGGAFACH